MYLSTMETLLRRSATKGFACSTEAGEALYGSSWRRDSRWSVFPCGIDLDPFREPARTSLREELGIPRGSFVVGHVGRFVELKNHLFLVDIAQAAVALGSPIHFLLVGDGELREVIEQRVAERGLRSAFTFAGLRSDVAALMTSAMDAFVLPSRREGLPVVLVEAQAAGLPCLVADTVSPESKVVDGLLFWESLRASPEVWAKRLLALRPAQPNARRELARRSFEGSPFDIQSNLQLLEACYAGH
jgi:glycosyltransferase involved in cell wall biosynthesis